MSVMHGKKWRQTNKDLIDDKCCGEGGDFIPQLFFYFFFLFFFLHCQSPYQNIHGMLRVGHNERQG